MSVKNINLQDISWPANEEEHVAFAMFKIAVADLEQEDTVIIRYLRARDHNLQNAEKMLRASITWRKESCITSYLHWTPPKCLEEEFGFMFKITGKDKEGRPVIWYPMGKSKGKECIDAGHKEDLFKWCYHFWESGMNAIKECGGRKQIVYIVGLEGLEMKRLFYVKVNQILFQICQMMEHNYPETIQTLVIINAPWYFIPFFNLMKPILSAITLSKIHIFDSNKEKYLKFMQDIMPIESIPECYLDA